MRRVTGTAAVVVGLALIASEGAALAERTYPVRIQSDPAGATVYVNDRDADPVGVTPLSADLPAGLHVLIVELDDHDIAIQDLRVTRRAKGQSVTVTLQAIEYAFVEITTAELDDSAEGATILLDGEAVGVVPATIKAVEGPHQIEVVKDGYETFEQWIELSRGERAELAVALEPGEAPVGGGGVVAPVGDGAVVAVGPRPAAPRLVLDAGLEVGWRRFRYQEGRSSNLRDYDARLTLVRVVAEVNPLPTAPNRLLKHMFLSLSVAEGTPLISETLDGSEQVDTTWRELDVGLSFRFPVAEAARVDVDLAFARSLFAFQTSGALAAQIPQVDYRMVRLGVAAGNQWGKVRPFAGADFLHVLSADPLAARFRDSQIFGLSARAGVGVRVLPRVEGRAQATYEYFGYSFGSEPGDSYDADGASDQFFALTFGGAYLF